VIQAGHQGPVVPGWRQSSSQAQIRSIASLRLHEDQEPWRPPVARGDHPISHGSGRFAKEHAARCHGNGEAAPHAVSVISDHAAAWPLMWKCAGLNRDLLTLTSGAARCRNFVGIRPRRCDRRVSAQSLATKVVRASYRPKGSVPYRGGPCGLGWS
jgi:hypothetical protein